MKLLDMPLEVVRATFAYLVESVPVAEAAKFREVNRIFSHEILVAIASTRALCLKSSPLENRRNQPELTSFCRFLARFLLIRPYCQERPWHANISAFLNHLLDELRVDTRDRREAMYVMCQYMVDHFRTGQPDDSEFAANCILEGLDSPPVKIDTSREPLEHHLLPSAILLKLPSIYEPILDSHEAHGSEACFASAYFTTPVYVAVKTGQIDLLRRLLSAKGATYSPAGSTSNPLDAAVANGDQVALEMLLDWAPFPQEQLGSALRLAAEASSITLAFPIVSHAYQHSIPIHDALETALSIACKGASLDFLDFLLDQPPVLEGEFARSPATDDEGRHIFSLSSSIDVAAMAGNTSVLKMLMIEGVMPDEHTFLLAIIGGHLGAVRVLLPTTKVAFMGVFWARSLSAAIKVWAGQSKEILQYLLEEAMAVKIAKGFWLYPATFGRLMHAACAYGNLEAFEILVRAGMPVDKPLCQPPNPFYFQQDEDWTPMMVALTSTKGQRLIVPRLIELGVEEVSRTQTRFWRAFELGVYPQTMHARQSAESGEVIEDLQPNAGLNLLDLQQTGIWGRDF